MKINLKNIKDLKNQWFTIIGLPSSYNIKDGTKMKVIWLNDLFIELHSRDNKRICIRTYIAKDVMCKI